MKPDSERKKRYKSGMHQKKKYLHVHLSKELREKLKIKTRSLLVNKGDTVKIVRGSNRGKGGKVSDVNYIKQKVYVEAITRKNLKAKEVPIPLEPSNLVITAVEMTKARNDIFKAEAKPKETITAAQHVKVETPVVATEGKK